MSRVNRELDSVCAVFVEDSDNSITSVEEMFPISSDSVPVEEKRSHY